jgi:hypothetical protein
LREKFLKKYSKIFFASDYLPFQLMLSKNAFTMPKQTSDKLIRIHHSLANEWLCIFKAHLSSNPEFVNSDYKLTRNVL